MILALLTCLTSFGQATKRERNLIKQGNEYFNKKQYSKAEESYSRVLEINPNSQIAKCSAKAAETVKKTCRATR